MKKRMGSFNTLLDFFKSKIGLKSEPVTWKAFQLSLRNQRDDVSKLVN